MRLSNLIRKTEKGIAGDAGFTIVELTIVMVVSVILIAGMVGLLSMAFANFKSTSSLASVTDSGRRALATMSRELKQALQFDNANTGIDQVTFWADINNDCPTTGSSCADVFNYTNAEKVQLKVQSGNLVQVTTQPGSSTPVTTTLASNVESVTFYYFQPGVKAVAPSPTESDPATNRYVGSDFNGDVGWTRIVLSAKKGKVARTLRTDVFLRILNRSQVQ
jgi:Tfp pilus assembly protein PilW